MSVAIGIPVPGTESHVPPGMSSSAVFIFFLSRAKQQSSGEKYVGGDSQTFNYNWTKTAQIAMGVDQRAAK